MVVTNDSRRVARARQAFDRRWQRWWWGPVLLPIAAAMAIDLASNISFWAFFVPLRAAWVALTLSPALFVLRKSISTDDRIAAGAWTWNAWILHAPWILGYALLRAMDLWARRMAAPHSGTSVFSTVYEDWMRPCVFAQPVLALAFAVVWFVSMNRIGERLSMTTERTKALDAGTWAGPGVFVLLCNSGCCMISMVEFAS